MTRLDSVRGGGGCAGKDALQDLACQVSTVTGGESFSKNIFPAS